MTLKEKIIFGAVVVVVAIAASWFVFFRSFGSPSFGAVGGLLAEHYIPYVSTNGGYNSALPIQTSGTLESTGLLETLGTFLVGSTGTTFSRLNGGQCYFAPSATTIAASTSIAVDCQATAAVSKSGESALTGITNGDNVLLQLSTTTAKSGVASFGGLVVSGASASSTAGYITVWLLNQTGTTYTWPTTGTASGTASYWVSH